MEYVLALLTNKFFLAPAVSWLVAQIIKVIIDSFKSGFSIERLYGGGGMPSSHAATVTGLVIVTAGICSLSSFEFAIALFFAIIIIYDARGVRYETQRQGKALNNLNYERQEEGKQPLDITRFKEKMGHTIPELVIGMIIGAICGAIVYRLPF